MTSEGYIDLALKCTPTLWIRGDSNGTVDVNDGSGFQGRQKRNAGHARYAMRRDGRSGTAARTCI